MEVLYDLLKYFVNIFKYKKIKYEKFAMDE
jgi:hypothetical protein